MAELTLSQKNVEDCLQRTLVSAGKVGISPAQILSWVIKYGQTAVTVVERLVAAYHRGTLVREVLKLLREGQVLDLIEGIVNAIESLAGEGKEEVEPAVG